MTDLSPKPMSANSLDVVRRLAAGERMASPVGATPQDWLIAAYRHILALRHEAEMAASKAEFETVTICGSMRFFDDMLIAAQQLSMDGWMVLAPFVRFVGEGQTT